MAKPLVILTVVFAVLSVAFLLISMRAFKKKRVMGTASNTLAALLMLSLSALFATLTVSTQGYRAFTREEVVAKVTTRRPVANSHHRLVQGESAGITKVPFCGKPWMISPLARATPSRLPKPSRWARPALVIKARSGRAIFVR